MRDVQAKKDRLTRVRDAQHDRVADRLHVSCARRQLTPDRVAEFRDQRRRLLVAVRFGQRREAGDVGEQESCRGVAQLYSSTLKLNIIPLSWCSAMWQ